ncbi:patatin-like phospholipase family protein [Acidovorax bellezanensis]
MTDTFPPSPDSSALPGAPLPVIAPTMGLLLTGGGARAAYQVGVLEAIAQIRRDCGQSHGANPFPILTGTSAGAINAAALACGADQFDHAVRKLARVWSHLHAENVYHADALSMLRSGARWLSMLSLGWALTRWRSVHPRSLLDNAPLATLLQSELVPLARLPTLVAQGHLRALSVTASSYSTGEHVSFYETHAQLQPWVRSQRRAVSGHISHAHLLASSAIPFIFPASPLDIDGHTEYFGDGSMRQTAPLAPAIHLGADRVLVIGAGRMQGPAENAAPLAPATYPTLAQIAGHTLSNIFLDALALDIERAQRVNATLTLIPPEARARSNLRTLELLVISPSQPLDAIAARHMAGLPRSMRTLLRTLGVTTDASDTRGAALASYLLFEPEYTRALMALGRRDTFARREEVIQFFGWHASAASTRASAPARRTRGNGRKNPATNPTPATSDASH